MGVKGPIETRPVSTKEKRFDFALGTFIKLVSMGGGAAGVIGLTMNIMPLEMAYYVLAVSFVVLCLSTLQDAITQRRDYIELKRNIRRVKINMNVYYDDLSDEREARHEEEREHERAQRRSGHDKEHDLPAEQVPLPETACVVAITEASDVAVSEEQSRKGEGHDA